MEKIKAITEAFSMQPNILSVSTQVKYENMQKYNPDFVGGCCKEIKLETIQVDTDKQCNVYVGYNFDGKKIFQYLQSSVNVDYKITE